MESIPENTAEKIHLSPRELQVAELLVQGFAQKEIAYKLGLSRMTIYFYLHNTKKKTGCPTLISAIAFLVDKGYILINSI